MSYHIIQKIEENPIIAAVKTTEGLENALSSNVSTIFLLHSNLFTVKNIVQQVHDRKKLLFLHLDFMTGFARDNASLDYIADSIKPDGILSTKNSDIKYLKQKDIFTVQRFFIIDSQSIDNTIRSISNSQPDMIEIMPAIIPNVIKQINNKIKTPIIAGGLIQNKNDIFSTLSSGAIGVSVSKKKLWDL